MNAAAKPTTSGPSAPEKARLAARSDAIVAELHNTPTNVEHPHDVVLCIDGAPGPWTLTNDSAIGTLYMLGGRELALEVDAFRRGLEANRVAVVVVVGTWIQLLSVGLRSMAKGGRA